MENYDCSLSINSNASNHSSYAFSATDYNKENDDLLSPLGPTKISVMKQKPKIDLETLQGCCRKEYTFLVLGISSLRKQEAGDKGSFCRLLAVI